jgi:Superinfection immunity protein
MSELTGFIAIVVLLIVYFAPSIIGLSRGINAGVALFLVNFFVGWTILFWIVCLIWAACGATKAQDAFYKTVHAQQPLNLVPASMPAEVGAIEHRVGRTIIRDLCWFGGLILIIYLIAWMTQAHADAIAKTQQSINQCTINKVDTICHMTVVEQINGDIDQQVRAQTGAIFLLHKHTLPPHTASNDRHDWSINNVRATLYTTSCIKTDDGEVDLCIGKELMRQGTDLLVLNRDPISPCLANDQLVPCNPGAMRGLPRCPRLAKTMGSRCSSLESGSSSRSSPGLTPLCMHM